MNIDNQLSPKPLLAPRCAITLTLALTGGCASHEVGPEPATPVPAPALIQEAEPARVLPPIVAPPLPELAPTRPLANLSPLWQHIPDHQAGDAAKPPPSTIWTLGRSALRIDSSDAAALGLPGPAIDFNQIPGQLRPPDPAAGPLVLLGDGRDFSAFDTDAGQIRWTTPELPEARSYTSVVSPRALVAHYYQATADRIAAWSLDDGRQLWLREGQSDAEFTRIKWLGTDGLRGYFTSEVGLVAFDLHSGATLWSATLAGPDCGVTAGEGVVVIEDPGGHRMLEAELGREIGRFDARGATACSWELYAYNGVAPAVIDGERLYAFDSQPPAQGASPLRAFALDTHAELWTAHGFDDDLLVVDHDAVFVARDERTLLALDADSGQPRAELSIGAPFDLQVEPVGGAAGPYVVVHDDELGRWVLGRSDTAPAPESFELRAQLVATDGLPKRRLAGLRVRVGEQIVKTDKRGRLHVKGSARGALLIEQAAAYGEYEPGEWTQVAIDPRRVVLDGSGSYLLGDIPAYEVSIE